MPKVLVVEAHSDDSAISACGFLIKLKKLSWNIDLCLVSSSKINFHHTGRVPKNLRLEEYRNYVTKIDANWVSSKVLPLNYEGRLDQFPRMKLVKYIEEVIEQSKPDLLIIQGPSFHHDHTAVYEATIAATRPTVRFFPKTILIMENPTYIHSLGPQTDFNPNFFVDLTEFELNQKLLLFEDCFTSQKRNSENSLSSEGIRAWARYRGIAARTKFAEAFHIFSMRI